MSENEDYLLVVARRIAEHESEFNRVAEELDSELSRIYEQSPRQVTREPLLDILTDILNSEIQDRETASQVASNLFGYLLVHREEYRILLNELDVSDEFIENLSEMKRKYQAYTTHVYLRARQGDDFFTDLRSDLVLRDPDGVAGINHEIWVGVDRRVDLTTSLKSNLNLIYALVEAEHEALRVFDENALMQIDREGLNEIIELLEDIDRRFRDLQEQESNNNE